ncbi:hypothetical protein [Streptomyces showdoensis]|uniref:Uncharacterized protein n=1 Tax=Streptomyces showdoensis TaxID=68268 RepID=A0A2P2GKU3_STREW|nr:hypothetical protein [Streptomyces showdoensis]KKZ71469.1 hypothetical protein VO63_23300 [Streptomyces showdoensis]
MVVLILSGVLALTVAGCVCVVWAARGGPRWTHGVAAATQAAGRLARGATRSGRKRNGGEYPFGGDGGAGGGE